MTESKRIHQTNNENMFQPPSFPFSKKVVTKMASPMGHVSPSIFKTKKSKKRICVGHHKRRGYVFREAAYMNLYVFMYVSSLIGSCM